MSDYSARVAEGLARVGAEVHVWAPLASPDAIDAEVETTGVLVHRASARWSSAGLRNLSRALDRFPTPRRLLAQYAPNVWGYKGMNLGFARWLVRRRVLGDDVRVMFHEPWYHLQPWDRPTRWILPLVQRGMARTALSASTRAYVSTSLWALMLRAVLPDDGPPITWLPVPSTILVTADPNGVKAIRNRVAPGGGPIIGSFGTFNGLISDLLSDTLPPLLEGTRAGMMIGRGSQEFVSRLVAARPELATRLHATGELSPREVSIHLQASDLLLLPYPEGLTGRRTTIMAGLAHGRAVVSTESWKTEEVWRESGAVTLAPVEDRSELIRRAAGLLDDSDARARMGIAARRLYDDHFALSRTITILTRPIESATGMEDEGDLVRSALDLR